MASESEEIEDLVFGPGDSSSVISEEAPYKQNSGAAKNAPDDNPRVSVNLALEVEFFEEDPTNCVVSQPKRWDTLPNHAIEIRSRRVTGAFSGPDTGFTRLFTSQDRSSGQAPLRAGSRDWSLADDSLYGVSISLYDQNPFNLRITGDPNADCFGITRRGQGADSCVVGVMCDGVNRGHKSRIAARAAVYGALNLLSATLFSSIEPVTSTHAVFGLLHQAMWEAHATVCTYVNHFTTITITATCPLRVKPLDSNKTHAVCTLTLGDSFAYLLRINKQNDPDAKLSSSCVTISELTELSHANLLEESHEFADGRSANTGGAIGPVEDHGAGQPWLGNLTFSYTQASPDDILVMTTDGVSDNFDPIVEKLAIPRLPTASSPLHDNSANSRNARKVSHEERQLLAMEKMVTCLKVFTDETGEQLNAANVCGQLMKHALFVSNEKRRVLENPALYEGLSSYDWRFVREKQRTEEVKSLLVNVPGKLDHASVCAANIR